MLSASKKTLSLSAIALLGMGLMAGCGNNDTPDFSSSSSAAESTSTSAEATTATSDSSSESSSASSDSSASAQAGSSSSSATSNTQAEAAPAGYVEVTAPTNKMSFAVPDSWAYASLDAEKAGDAGNEMMQKLADAQGISLDEVKTQLESTDLVVASTDESSGVRENVNVIKQTVQSSTVPAKSDVEDMLSPLSATLDSYKVVDTSLGQAVRAAYTMPVGDSKVHGEYIITPNGADGAYSFITVTTGDAQTSAGYADVIQKTLKKSE